MRDLSDLPINLMLYDSVQRGSGRLWNVTAQIGRTWRRSIRRIGGFWVGTCEYEGTRDEMEEIFLEVLTRELRETVGGLVTWEGFLGKMLLTVDGEQHQRAWSEVANRVKSIYTRIGDNQFTNGSAESGAWAAYNTPSTLEQSTTWVSDGDYSCHIVANSVEDGATIQTGITVVAEKYYECRVSVNLMSGTWTLEIYRTDTDEALGKSSQGQAGQYVMRASIGNANEYAGTIGVRIYCEEASGEIYGDAGVFQEGPCRAETSWYEDTASQVEWGVKELALLKAGMSDASANAEAQRVLKEHAWPRTRPPNRFGEGIFKENRDKLELTFLGYCFTTRNRYTTVTGTDAASAHVTALAGQCEFVSAGIVQANTMDFQIEDRAPVRVWDAFREIGEAGDGSGARWELGVYGGKELIYKPADTTLVARYRDGQLLHTAGGRMEPWFMRPGLVQMDNLVIGPGQVTTEQADNPRVMNIDEVEFDAESWLAGKSGARFTREAGKESNF